MNTTRITSDYYTALELFSRYYMALLIILGTFGNGFCIVAYITSDLKKYGSTRYLIALSISDLGFVVCMSLTWIKTFDLNWQAFSGLCEISTYLSSVCCFLSGWYVTLLSGERCLAVCWPYLARRICTATRTTCLISILALLAAVINLPLFYLAKSVNGEIDEPTPSPNLDAILNDQTEDESILQQYWTDHRNMKSWNEYSNIHKFWDEEPSNIVRNVDYPQPPKNENENMERINYYCGVNPGSETVYTAFNTIDTVLSFTLPLLLTLLLNVAIAYSLCRAAQERKKLMTADGTISRSRSSTFTKRQPTRDESSRRNALLVSTGPNGYPTTRVASGSNQSTGSNMLERKITSVLVAKCVAYLILNLPSYLHRIMLAFENPVGEETSEHNTTVSDEINAESVMKNRIIEMLVYLLFYTQFSTNFLLYSFSACVNGAIRFRTDSNSMRLSNRKARVV